MHKSPLLILLILLAALGGGLYLWTSGGDQVLPMTAEDFRESESLDPDALEFEDEIQGEAAELGDESEDELSEGMNALAREALPDQQARSTWHVQVWDRRRGRPAVGAKVQFLDGFEEGVSRGPFSPHWSTLAEGRGLTFTTDEKGRVELPPVKSHAIITASAPGLFGFTRVRIDHDDVESITMQGDETVTVRVVDGAGKPVAGIPVGILQKVPEFQDLNRVLGQWKRMAAEMDELQKYLQANPGQRDRAMERIQSLKARQAQMQTAKQQAEKLLRTQAAREKGKAKNNKLPRRITPQLELRTKRKTSAAGIAVFRHFQLYRKRARRDWPEDYRSQFEAALLLPLESSETVNFAGQPVPEETLELVLPPLGGISFRTVDRDGRPFAHPVHAELRMNSLHAREWKRVKASKEQNAPALDFSQVGLGLSFWVSCSLDDEDFGWITREPVQGPTNPGEVTHVDLVVAPDLGMLYGRMLNADGVPLANQKPSFLINTAKGRLEGEEIRLSPEGRFHFPYIVGPNELGPFNFEIRSEHVQPTIGAAVTMDVLPMQHVTDLGDVQIGNLGLVAQGLVLNDRGEPVSGASLQLQRERNVDLDRPRMDFVDEAYSETKSGEDGHYELFGQMERARYRLHVTAREHFPTNTEDLGRGEPVDVELLRRSRILGNVLMPDWMRSRNLRVRLTSATNPEERRDEQINRAAGKHYVFFDWTRPGVYGLEFRLQGFPDPFLNFSQVELLPGQKGMHPRLKDIDLGQYLFRYELTAVDENGRGLSVDRPLLAKVVRPDGRSGFIAFPWKSGKTEVISASAQLELRPLSTGYVSDVRVLGQGENEIVFRKVPAVELGLPGVRDVIGDHVLHLQLQFVRGDGLPGELLVWDRASRRLSQAYQKQGNAVRTIEAGRESVRMQLARGGVYRVVGWLGGKKVRVNFGEVSVELRPGEEVVAVNVGWDVETLQAAVARLGG